MNHIAVVTTIGDLIEAQHMALTLVEQRLAACAQISEIESFYVWDGAVQNEKEFRILFKTTDENYQAVEEAIRALHSYDLPAIHAFAFEHVYGPYAAWIEDNSSGQS